MEIRDPLHGTIFLTDSETAVIESVELQRLRAIKQLGFSEFSFPGATHNRFLHSIGVSHISGLAFDSIFRSFPFSDPQVRLRFRMTLKLASLLHDVGHGPLSHTTEEVMPYLSQLQIKAYENRMRTFRQADLLFNDELRATHEDYTIKFITDSPLTDVLKKSFSDIDPIYIASLIDKSITCGNDFFSDQGICFRPILSQLISSELDCDRMDYLERDSYFSGTSYGRFDLNWLLNNMAGYMHGGDLFLALNRRALYSFDDFLLSRHHMHLMVYFHHKSIIYEEMLNRYLTSKDCSFFLPADIQQYTSYNDYKLFEHLASRSDNVWAQRISQRRPFRVLIELHSTEENVRSENIRRVLEEQGIETIMASSKTRLSKYHSGTPEDRVYQIYVVDQYDRWDKPVPIDQSTEIFQKYQGNRIIDRLYVAPEKYSSAEKILLDKRL